MNYSQEINDSRYIDRDGRMYRVTATGEQPICNAVIDRNGEKVRCKAIALSGQDFCFHHGTELIKRNEKPQFLAHAYKVNRRRFAKAGKDLLDKVDAHREDPELFSLRDDTAYITALVDVRAEAAGEGVSIEQYRKIESAYNLARSKLGSPDFIDAFEQIGDLLKESLDEYSASKDVLELISRRADLVEAEQRMMQTKSYTLEADQAFMLIMQIVEVVKTSVRDADVLTAVKAGINKLLRQHKQEVDDPIEDAVVIDG
jgi:hypothetical protein